MFGHSKTQAEGYARWQKLFAFIDGPPSQRVISVGNNFQHDYGRSKINFMPVFRAIDAAFDAILPRDSFSFQNISRRVGFDRMARVQQGMDCAFLLPPLPPMEKQDIFTCFFGRSGFEAPERLIAMVEEQTGLRAAPINTWLKLRDSTADADFEAARHQILQSRFVLTDTYHLSINSFTLGVPVIGMGRAEERQRGTLGDFKKKILFDMLNLRSLYCEAGAEEENEYFRQVTEKIRYELARNFNLPDRHALLRHLADKFRADLDAAIFGPPGWQAPAASPDSCKQPAPV
ncbi:polysaccharide pyruvyl transferase family protein [Plastorhodobacter daqingensis]|uniref:Polysaccharide pyruvyl transferase family protein n=1 Tax=Plastorhodobacter daqingensis TaxID=1387281 RepID=A0ABW2UK37_9RHOB